MSTADTWLIDGMDIHTVADVADFTGILSEAPANGELVERDFIAGGVWISAPPAAYTYDVPVIMASDDEDEALEQLAALQEVIGATHTFTRKVTRGGTQVTETHQGIVSSITVGPWNLTDARNLVEATLIILNTSGGWAAA